MFFIVDTRTLLARVEPAVGIAHVAAHARAVDCCDVIVVQCTARARAAARRVDARRVDALRRAAVEIHNAPRVVEQATLMSVAASEIQQRAGDGNAQRRLVVVVCQRAV